MNQPRVLFVAAEASPLIKVGGLADVVGSLPAALNARGVETRVCIPKYGAVRAAHLPPSHRVASLDVPWQGRLIVTTIEETQLPSSSTTLYLVDAPEMFATGGIYFEHDVGRGQQLSMERFTFFSWAIAHLLGHLQWQPDIVHCHDWHAATLPVFLDLVGRSRPSVLTIHNIEGQGRWSAAEVFAWLGVRGNESSWLSLRDQAGNYNALQIGINAATSLTTVSPTYARELLGVDFGNGLERDIAARPHGIEGILNGIDVVSFDPTTDAALSTRYSADTVAVGKLLNKRALFRELGLPAAMGPLFGFVGRLASQKGIDLVTAVIPDIVSAGGHLVVLGSGVPNIEKLIRQAARRHPDNVRVRVAFDARLAQRIYAATDFFLMPSRFEPCGLGQLIAMRYGALPIVNDTGGLHDTVVDLGSGAGTGIVFAGPDVALLRGAIERALRVFRQPDMMNAARDRAMAKDFSWTKAAEQYVTLYAQTTTK